MYGQKESELPATRSHLLQEELKQSAIVKLTNTSLVRRGVYRNSNAYAVQVSGVYMRQANACAL